MTCIVGLVHKNRVYMGCDSAGTSGWDLTIRSDTKLFRNGPFLVGFTHSFRMGQLLRHSFQPPDREESQDPEQFMVTTFIDAVRTCLKAGGYASKQNDVESGGFFMVGYQGRLFVIEADYQVGVPVCGFAALGSGANVALGSLYTTSHYNEHPETRIRLALETAEALNGAVRGPFRQEVLE